jgi:hypothetical protein
LEEKMADWKVARVSQVFATIDPLYAMVLLEETLPEGGEARTWRRIEPRSADGCSNVFQIATGAWVRVHDLILYLLNDAGELTAMANFLI